MTKVVRDQAWVEREYNREKYPRLEAVAKAAIARGVRGLPALFGAVFRAEQGSIDALASRPFIAGGERHALPVPFGQWGIIGTINQFIGDLCTENTGDIIELGAGWGRNLFMAHLTGMIGARARIHALEYAESGRRTARLVAGQDPTLNFKALAFDYHVPDFSEIEPSLKPAIVTTIHSVEQIPTLKREVFTRLIERLPNLTGLHIEPVGWQLPRGAAEPAALSSPAYAERHDYNRNLWQVLDALAQDGVIEITTVARDVMGMNADNPSSIIVWRTRSGA